MYFEGFLLAIYTFMIIYLLDELIFLSLIISLVWKSTFLILYSNSSFVLISINKRIFFSNLSILFYLK